MRKSLLLLLLLALSAGTAQAQNVLKTWVGANGIWYKDEARPSDFEVGGNVAASLSPHISAVGSSYYGFINSYIRGTLGARITATDVADPFFSIGLGLQYHMSSEPKIHAQEWAPDVSIGWIPWRDRLPAVSLVALAYYGLTTNQAYATVGARYALGNLK